MKKLALLKELPASATWGSLARADASGRWLLLAEGAREPVLFDASADFERTFTYPLASAGSVLALSPSGSLAVRAGDSLRILSKDGSVLETVEIPAWEHDYLTEELAFASDGRFLWLATCQDDKGLLLLLDATTLATLDSFESPDGPWGEVSFAVDPGLGCLAVNHSAGDTQISLRFFHVNKARIQPHSHAFLPLDPDTPCDVDPFDFLGFSPDGRLFAGLDAQDQLWERTWPECAYSSSSHPLSASPEKDEGEDEDEDEDEEEDWERLGGGYCGLALVVGMKDLDEERVVLRVLEPGTLEKREELTLSSAISELEVVGGRILTWSEDEAMIQVWSLPT